MIIASIYGHVDGSSLLVAHRLVAMVLWINWRPWPCLSFQGAHTSSI